MRQLFKAEVRLPRKARIVTQGYRPTLSFSGEKVLSNFDEIEPNPLRPSDVGRATIRTWWDRSGKSPILPGAKFEVLEAERCVGDGVVVAMLPG